jgi:hypothetical protein
MKARTSLQVWMEGYLLRNQEGNSDCFTSAIENWTDGVQMFLPRTMLCAPEEVRRGVDFSPTITASSSRGTIDRINRLGG